MKALRVSLLSIYATAFTKSETEPRRSGEDVRRSILGLKPPIKMMGWGSGFGSQ